MPTIPLTPQDAPGAARAAVARHYGRLAVPAGDVHALAVDVAGWHPDIHAAALAEITRALSASVLAQLAVEEHAVFPLLAPALAAGAVEVLHADHDQLRAQLAALHDLCALAGELDEMRRIELQATLFGLWTLLVAHATKEQAVVAAAVEQLDERTAGELIDVLDRRAQVRRHVTGRAL